MSVHTVSCPACSHRFEVEFLRQGEDVCGAPYPDGEDTRCHLTPHVDGLVDAQHEATGPSGGTIRWFDSEF